MKRILIITSILIFFTSCKKEEKEICGCKNPKTELQWLNQLIKNAENDTTGIYTGQIYYEVVNNQEMFFVLMELDTINGNIKHWFNCDGEKITFTFSEEPKNMKLNHLIYSNYKIDKN
ncbi:MAG TPA: hypothetical protein ENN90_01900 [Mariniphaga anaerophila]|uniref:Uncharacterized protein n=1 Tax=Mariniphaga anaerophila TaxID=1484053 RepID=A0A831PPU5_9BACT|nr:hypothetical protein [Mariniphaga anaerophila]